MGYEKVEEAKHNYYAKSPMVGRKSKGTLCGLRFKNKSRDYKIRIIAVCWQTWAVDIYDGGTDNYIDTIMLHQSGEELPTFEIRNAWVYRHGYNFRTTGCDVYSA